MAPEGRFFNAGGFMPPMTTYAQNFEDVTLRRALQDIECGFYVDIGACHPTELSVTRWFYDQGWRGINIEPNPHFLRILQAERPRDINLGVAVSNAEQSTTLHVIGDTGLSTIEPEFAANQGVTETLKVKAVKLDQILEESEPIPTIDFLKIDAEGSELSIIQGATFTRYRPRIILSEATGLHHYLPIMQSRGYQFVYFDGLNPFFVRDEDMHRAELLARPPSLWDNFIPPKHPAERPARQLFATIRSLLFTVLTLR